MTNEAHTTIAPTRSRPSRVTFTRARRERLEAALQEIVDLLDEFDDDPDLEPEPLEPYFADCNGENDEREPSEDPEPSLGATGTINQTIGWTKHGGGCDHEQGDDTGIVDAMSLNPDDEANGDIEPSLGAAEQHPRGERRTTFYGEPLRAMDGRSSEGSQAVWSGGNLDDREGDEHDGREDGHDAENDTADMEHSLGWTLDCSRGKTGSTTIGDNSDREPNGDEMDFSGSEDDVGTIGKSCSDWPAAQAVLAQLPSIVGSQLEVVGLDGDIYLVTKV